MQLILEGIVLGLTLTILLGPIFIALTQSSLEGGSEAGLTVGLGVWVSDILIISVCYLFVHRLSLLVEDHSFTYWLGLLGGFVLITFGIGTFLKKSVFEADQTLPRLTTKNYLSYFMKGFLVNTVNPFTFAFWISVISTYVIGRNISHNDAMLFFGTIMVVIIITDVLKVVLAKIIRNKLNSEHIDMFSKVAGVVLLIFGVVLLVRVGVV